MRQSFICWLSISRAPLQASTSSSCARSGKPSRMRNSSSFHEPRRIFTLLARHCELNGPKRISLSPLSGAGVTLKPLRARTRWNAWLLPACPGSLPNPMRTLFAILLGNTEQVPFDVARVGSRPYHIQQPIAAAAIAAELDTDRPIRVVELGFFRGREIPIADDVEIRRHLVDNGTPLPFEIQPGGGPDLPIAAEQPLARECRQ